MNNYEIAQEGFRGVIKATETPMQSFDRKNYRAAFDKVYESLVPAFDALQSLYVSVKEPQTLVDNMAAEVVQAAQEELEACKKKSQREIKMMNLNLQLAVFINPAILHYKGDFARDLTDQLGKRWKEAFPKTNVQVADLETIEKGFHRKFCYITTAVCRSFGKPDDCRELTIFRAFRDGYLNQDPEGEALVRRYYDIAPTIVKHIDARPDTDRIYRHIWDAYLSDCLHMIEAGESEACVRLYRQMVDDMQAQYFYLPVCAAPTQTTAAV